MIDSNAFDSEVLDNWIVNGNLDGITFEYGNWDGLGMRGNVSCPMLFQDVQMDKKYRIGSGGSGIEQIFNAV